MPAKTRSLLLFVLAAGLQPGCNPVDSPAPTPPVPIAGVYDADSAAGFPILAELPILSTMSRYVCLSVPDLGLYHVIVLRHSLTFEQGADSVLMTYAVERFNCPNGMSETPRYDTLSGQVRRFFRQAGDTILIYHVPTGGPVPPSPYVETAIRSTSDTLRGYPFHYRLRKP